MTSQKKRYPLNLGLQVERVFQFPEVLFDHKISKNKEAINNLMSHFKITIIMAWNKFCIVNNHSQFVVLSCLWSDPLKNRKLFSLVNMYIYDRLMSRCNDYKTKEKCCLHILYGNISPLEPFLRLIINLVSWNYVCYQNISLFSTTQLAFIYHIYIGKVCDTKTLIFLTFSFIKIKV